MRFGIRDLLNFFVLSSIYCAGCALLTDTGGASSITLVVAACFVFGFIGLTIALFNTLYFENVAGEVLLTVISPAVWWPHHLSAAAFLIGVSAVTASTDTSLSAMAGYFLLSAIAVHIHMLVSRKVVLGSRAVIVDSRCRTWKRCRFSVSSKKGQAWLIVNTPWYRFNQKARLPADRLEEVESLLATKQGTNMHPPMNADQRG